MENKKSANGPKPTDALCTKRIFIPFKEERIEIRYKIIISLLYDKSSITPFHLRATAFTFGQ
jgi:hypothetical protein